MLDQDIVIDFQKETKDLLNELENIVGALEESKDDFPSQELEQFAQRIDRIMGAAQTLNMLAPEHLGLRRVGALAQICKQLGYKASEYKVALLIPIFAAFWADTLEAIGELIDSLGDDEKSASLAESFSSVLQNRLIWLSDKVQKMAPKSVRVESQLEVDKLMESFNQT